MQRRKSFLQGTNCLFLLFAGKRKVFQMVLQDECVQRGSLNDCPDGMEVYPDAFGNGKKTFISVLLNYNHRFNTPFSNQLNANAR